MIYKGGRPLGFADGLGDPTGSTLVPEPAEPTPGYDVNLVDSLNRIWDYEYDIRLPLEREWNRSMDRFNNIWDFSKKSSWQSRRGVPNYMKLVYTITWELAKPVMLSTGPLYKASTDISPWRDVFMVAEKLVARRLKSNGENPAGDYSKVWYQCMLSAVTTGNCYMLIVPENEGMVNLNPDTEDEIFGDDPDDLEPLGLKLPSLSGEDTFDLPSLQEEADDLPTVDEAFKEYRLRFEALNPRDVLMDSGGYPRYKYVMWRQRLTPWEFRKLGTKHGWDNVEKIIAEKATTTKKASPDQKRKSRENGEAAPPKDLNTIELCHFVGTLLDEKGEALFENEYCSWSGNHVTQQPRDLGFWHGKLPIIHSGMLQRSFGAYHQSMAVANLDPQEARVELLNSLLDYMHQVINPPTQIDHDLIHQSYGNQWKSGMSPGGVLHAQTRGSGSPVASRVNMPDMPTGAWQGMGFLKQELTESTGQADIGTMPRTRNRISADEAQERQMMSGGIWQQTILNIETDFLNQSLYMAYCLELQMIPQRQWEAVIDSCIDELALPANPEAEEDVDEAINPNQPTIKKLNKMRTWDARKRWRMMATVFRFESRVFSSIESRRRSLEKLKVMSESAVANPVMASRMRWHRVAEQFILALEEDPSEFLWPNSGDTAEQQQPPGVAPPGAPAPVNPIVQPPPGKGGLIG